MRPIVHYRERSMSALLDRFCRYVRMDTQAQESSGTYPSSPGQWELARLLAGELRELGAHNVEVTDYALVYATLPATVREKAPTIAWLAHMDTSPEFSGRHVKPIIHQNYQGGDIALPGDSRQVITLRNNPELQSMHGKTLVTSDGTTLLGSDDKSGVAVIMTAAEQLLRHPEIAHGTIRICFTCDEEIGHGVDHLDPKHLGALAAYTLDGASAGEYEAETFSADKATVTLRGVVIHPMMAKGRMVNAIKLAAEFLEKLPKDRFSPETTSGRESFVHPISVEGGVPEAKIRFLLRSFQTAELAEQAQFLRRLGQELCAAHPPAQVEVAVEKQYRNMADGMAKEPRALPYAELAIRRAGLSPKKLSIRGGTDGSRLTELGVPTPNLFTGEHNPHSPLEWTCLEEMEQAVKVLVELAQVWAEGPTIT
jgi:tripeptide aminopeptidase